MESSHQVAGTIEIETNSSWHIPSTPILTKPIPKTIKSRVPSQNRVKISIIATNKIEISNEEFIEVTLQIRSTYGKQL